VVTASVQDRDGGRPLLWRLAARFRTVTLVWADGGYAGQLVTWAASTLHRTLQIVKRPDDLHTFKALPRRWSSSAHSDGSCSTGAASATTSGCPNTTRPTSTGR
jgi:hypothetical protein